MTSFVAKKVANRLFAGQAKAMEPIDPHREHYVTETGRKKTRLRALPEGLSKRDKKLLISVRRRASYLDRGFTICGFRFGWTFLLALIPFAGDVASALLNYSLLRRCKEADLPPSLAQRMWFNNAISFGAGMIPIVGDVFLAAFKANSRNAALFEEFLVARVALERQAAATPGPAAHDRINNLAAGSALAVPVDTSEGALVGVDREVVVVSKPATKKKQWYGWGKGSNAL